MTDFVNLENPMPEPSREQQLTDNLHRSQRENFFLIQALDSVNPHYVTQALLNAAEDHIRSVTGERDALRAQQELAKLKMEKVLRQAEMLAGYADTVEQSNKVGRDTDIDVVVGYLRNTANAIQMMAGL